VSSAIGLGCLGFTGAYGRAGLDRAVPVIRVALDLGITLLDLADFYSGGAIEEQVAAAVAGRRDEALIATRGGLRFTRAGQVTRADGSPSYLKAACEASLRRLGTNHIDLYFLAKVDPRVPIEESVGALAELVRAGKVRHIGLPAIPRDMLRRAYAEHRIAAVAGEYSLWERGVENGVLAAARELAIFFLACRPLGRGFLTGRITLSSQLTNGDLRRKDPRFTEESLRRNREILRAAETIASHRDLSMGRLALAWLLAQGDDIVPVPGSCDPTHVEMNASAVRVHLSADECREVAAPFPVSAAALYHLPFPDSGERSSTPRPPC
jgi:aryl-alcohol dehydrogenase-like predicted oxidoreductase